jgi:hypothetical protein
MLDKTEDRITKEVSKQKYKVSETVGLFLAYFTLTGKYILTTAHHALAVFWLH